ncbi:hypothetical protein VE00_04342 [Pseudogymnoascus sp. WSF 3629]|nr:hypothetical protein VE00_04342 [Pseudogymnoascus sp. WSF 3629]
MAPLQSLNAPTRTSTRTPKPSARKRAQSTTTPILTRQQKKRKGIPKLSINALIPRLSSAVILSDVEQDSLDTAEDAEEADAKEAKEEEAKEEEAKEEEAEEEESKEAKEETLKFMSI